MFDFILIAVVLGFGLALQHFALEPLAKGNGLRFKSNAKCF